VKVMRDTAKDDANAGYNLAKQRTAPINAMLQGHYSGFTVALQWRYSGVAIVLQ
jgi:hypothetical protein